MTYCQKIMFARVLDDVRATHFHFGDCIGADTDAFVIAGTHSLTRISHPANNVPRRFLAINPAEWIRQPKSALVRNRDIVNESELIIACPKEFTEKQRSGTWATIRYARKQNVRVIIVYPDGRIEDGNSSTEPELPVLSVSECDR